MYKEFFSFLLITLLSCLSFYFTNFIVDYVKELDPIMINIKNNQNNYKKIPVNASVDDVSITPGINGYNINLNSSYKLMKKYGAYNSNLLIFEKASPNISINNIYDKYIFNGNKNFNNVALVFKINNTNYLEEIIDILNKKEVVGTFFINEEILKENRDVIKLLYLNNQNIESLGNGKSYSNLEIDRMNHLLKSYISKSLSYCYSDDINSKVLKICSNKKLHTIIPSINTNKFPYYQIKDKLFNGAIIKFDNGVNTLGELDYIINYIRQSGFKIVSLEKLLSE